MHEITLISALDKSETSKGLYEEKDIEYIFETYYKRVYNFVYYRVSCQYTAEDLTSLIFEKVMLKINTFSENKASFEVWLFAIARNVVNDYYRNVKKRKFLSIDTIKELVSKRKTPEDVIEIAETNDKLSKALNTLNTRDRNIVALKFGANLKNVQIAEILDLTESNVGVILYRTMRKLKSKLEREDIYE